LILKKIFSYGGRSKSHYHVPDFVINLIKNDAKDVDKSNSKEVVHSQNCKSPHAEKGLSTIIRTKQKK